MEHFKVILGPISFAVEPPKFLYFDKFYIGHDLDILRFELPSTYHLIHSIILSLMEHFKVVVGWRD